MNYAAPVAASLHATESLRLEGVTTSVGFDDVLDVTLGLNHPHLDTMIVVTSPEDRATQLVAKKHSAIRVTTDLFKKNGRPFNKGAAINAGFDLFQYHGWRLHLDVDIALPDNFRRVLFNHTHLDQACLYGAARRDVVGQAGLAAFLQGRLAVPQLAFNSGLSAEHGGALPVPGPSASSAQYVDSLRGYCPIGFFQLWHCSQQRPYPYSLGTACHDDVIFAQSWPLANRRLLPSVVCYHIVARLPYYGENWDGNRRQPRLT